MQRAFKRQRSELEKAEQLCSASSNGDLETVKRLIEIQGVDVNAENRNHFTAFYYACRNNHTDIILYLLSEPSLNIYRHMNISCYSPVEYLVQDGNLAVLRILLSDSRFQINRHEEITNYTVIDRACKHNQWEVAKLLLDQPNLDLFEPTKTTMPLTLRRTLEKDKLDIAKRIVEKWASISIARHWYAWRGFPLRKHMLRFWPRYRPRWTKQNHKKWPDELRAQIFAWLLVCRRRRLVSHNIRLLMCGYVCEAWKEWKVDEIDRKLKK